ncbi:MAG: M1 family metallopeptidase [Salibacteraceae bacterium]|nr:M1 family metallopeptidase [Salibacteraceae bacterium]|tara:strand:+ start:13393 stop:15267 length:1875 start_codon:yes stop_codon:yes gene_type:complete
MSKKPLSLILLFISLIQLSFAQNGYWQQRAEYKMEVALNVDNHKVTGSQELKYFNNSPDTLKKVYYHLYFNAFQPGSMMDARSRSIKDPDSRVGDRIKKLSENEIGYQKIETLKQNGNDVTWSIDQTLLTVMLNTPLLPGKSSTFNMEFESQVPVQIRRSGRDNAEGVAYSMTQWYPKMAEYDKDGWMTDPYVGREFHGVWSDFDVKITIDSSFTIGGSGYLQNPEEIGHGYIEASKVKRPNSKELTWHFIAPKVHDFAWAADPDYIHDIRKTSFGLDLHFIYKNDSNIANNWQKLQSYTEESFSIVNNMFGEYPYKQYSVIQGGDGGMEYPMATLISGTGSFGGLVSVTVHESLHSWYYGLLATNENKYPWMDEGFTQFAQYHVLDSLFHRRLTNPAAAALKNYRRIAIDKDYEPMSTHADYFHSNRVYGINSYYKGATFLSQLSYIVGDDIFFPAMREYYYTWRYKHPTPDDFKRVMEKAADMDLDWYFTLWIGGTKTIDYGIAEVNESKKNTEVIIERIGQMPMPTEMLVTLNDDSQQRFYIPLFNMRGEKNFSEKTNTTICSSWPWTHPNYRLIIPIKKDKIKSIVLDPEGRVADLDLSNDSYPESGDAKQKVYFEGKTK